MGDWQIAVVGMAVGMVVATVLQRAWRYRREFRQAKTNSDLVAAAQSLQDLKDWHWTVDTAGVFTSSSESCFNLIGYTAAELVGTNFGTMMDPGELMRAEAMIDHLGGTDPGLSELVIEGRHRDGSATWFEVSARTLSDGDQMITGYGGRSRLISAEAAQVEAVQHIKARIELIIADRLLLMAFQPIVDLSTSKVIGVEALSRFVADPASTPDVWFAEAARVGLGTELELLAVDIALTAAGALPEHLYVSINSSPSTCLDDRFSQLITTSGIRLDRIVVELTEHAEVVNYEPLNDILAVLRRQGVRVAIDDAGAGFASGQHILKINPNIIKLDRSLVTAIDSRSGEKALAASLIALANHIGATVTAEGIETRAELKCLAALGVNAGQGYLLSRPSVTPREWARWKSRTPARELSTSHASNSATTRPSTQLPTNQANGTAPTGAPDRTGAGHPHWDGASAGLRGDGTVDPQHGQLNGRPLTAAFAAAALDALPDSTAVLDGAGRIIAVNRAWRIFARDNRGDPTETGVGVNYLHTCAAAASRGNPDAIEMLDGLRAVLAGRVVEHEWEYALSSPSVDRWFVTRITPIGQPTGGAIVAHVNISSRKRAEEFLVHQASHDSLTGLANRLRFNDDLADALLPRPDDTPHPDIGVLYVDLDNFKLINDAHGHAAGDELLLVATNRMRAEIRASDTIARLGGDEFAVCAPRITAEGLRGMADRISASLSRPHQLRGRQLHITASVGVYLARMGESATDALHQADLNMYLVKGLRDRAPVLPSEQRQDH